jgi:hypothetical protein
MPDRPDRSPRCIIQAQSLGVLPCPLAALFPHASKTDDTMQCRIHCIYDDIPFLVRRHSQHDVRCLCPCRPRCYCPLAFAEVLFRSSSRTPILPMEKGRVTDAPIECPCCLPHLMLSGVPGMGTPATDDLVLIMNVTPVLVLASLLPGFLSLQSRLATLFPSDYDHNVLRP